MLRQTEPMAMIAAVLHDLVEDTSWTLEELAEAGVPEPALAAVACLKRREENGVRESYEPFIECVAANPLAVAVKLADLEDNMDLRRIVWLGAADLERSKSTTAPGADSWNWPNATA